MTGGPDWPWPEPAPGGPDDLARAAARCLSGADGDLVLAHLRTITVERRCRPDIGEAELRHLEGQRFLVAYLAALAARGRT